MRRQCSRKSRPTAVSCTPRGCRVNSRTPNSCSSLLIWRVRAGCTNPSCSAARVMLPLSATATKNLMLLRSMASCGYPEPDHARNGAAITKTDASRTEKAFVPAVVGSYDRATTTPGCTAPGATGDNDALCNLLGAGGGLAVAAGPGPESGPISQPPRDRRRAHVGRRHGG